MSLPPEFLAWMKVVQTTMESTLASALPNSSQGSNRLHAAMRYATLEGGKRVRALLVFAAGELFNAPAKRLAQCASAIEMIHAYSLVHDDMPCMDNDILRRGKPTVHVHYDEATALLAGDALQSHAFWLLTHESDIDPVQQIAMIRLLAHAAGSFGMCGGQAIDLESVGKPLTLNELEQMHALKTGALLRASVLLGAMSGKFLTEPEIEKLTAYAQAIGLAFQVVDDILDITADSDALGKTAGKDAADNKPTYPAILGLAASQQLADQLCQDAHTAIEYFGPSATHLHQIADFVVQRKA